MRTIYIYIAYGSSIDEHKYGCMCEFWCGVTANVSMSVCFCVSRNCIGPQQFVKVEPEWQ